MERSDDIAEILEVGGYNGIRNPSFETGVGDGWGASDGATITQITSDAAPGYGSACARLTTTDDNQWIDTPLARYRPGKEHTFSAWVKGTEGDTIHLNIYTGSVDSDGDAFELTGDWQRIYRTVAVANTGLPKIQIRRYSGDSADPVYVDAVMVQIGDQVNTYIDGSLGTGHHWVGTAHNSISYRNSREEA